MSSLDALLSELRQSLAEKGVPATVAPPQSDTSVDSATASAALKDFLSKAKAGVIAKDIAEEDPRTVSERRSALSSFVGLPLGTSGVTIVFQPIQPKPPQAHGHGKSHGAPQASAAPVTTPTCIKCESLSAAPPLQTKSAPCLKCESAAGSPATVPTCTTCETLKKAPATVPTCINCETLAKTPPPPPPQPVMGLPITPTAAAGTFAWDRHIMVVESALRMGDAHFAESLLTLLLEIWPAISTDRGVFSRLKSQQAMIRIDRKQFAEVEADLLDCLRSLPGTPYTKTLGAAYCMLALSKYYDSQQNIEKAQTTQRNAILIAEKVLGADHPEVKCFR